MTSATDSLGQVPVINKSAVIQLSIGTLSISHIQLALSLLTKGLVPGIADRISAGTVSEPTEIAVVGLSNLLRHIYQLAQDTNQTTMQEISLSDLG